MNLSFVAFKVNLINNSEQWWVDIDAKKTCMYQEEDVFHLKKKWMEKTYIRGTPQPQKY